LQNAECFKALRAEVEGKQKEGETFWLAFVSQGANDDPELLREKVKFVANAQHKHNTHTHTHNILQLADGRF
jgi:hypothetical protein